MSNYALPAPPSQSPTGKCQRAPKDRECKSLEEGWKRLLEKYRPLKQMKPKGNTEEIKKLFERYCLKFQYQFANFVGQAKRHQKNHPDCPIAGEILEKAADRRAMRGFYCKAEKVDGKKERRDPLKIDGHIFHSRTDAAVRWLLDVLSHRGEVPVSSLKGMAEEQGFSWRTVERARSLLKDAIFTRRKGRDGKDRFWKLLT